MALPKQIQRQADEAEEIQKKLAAEQSPEPKAEPEQPSNTEPAAAPTLVEEPKPAEQSKPDNWEHKYKTLTGIHNATVGQLKRDNTALSQQLGELKGQIDELRAQQAQPQKVAGESDAPDQKDVETFGADLVEMATRIARKEIDRVNRAHAVEVAELRRAVGERVDAVAQTQQRSADEMFFDRLTQTLPNWETVQGTDECQLWLGTRVPGATYSWNDVLNNAAQRHDVGAVNEVFQTFFERYPQHNPRPATPAVPATELQRQVTPSTSKASAPVQQQNRKVYTSPEFEAESMRVVRLAKSGRTDEATRLESELNAAIAEGRIRP